MFFEKLKVRRVAGKLGLSYMDQDFPGKKKCNDCDRSLNIGRDRNGLIQAFCSKCGKITHTVLAPRFPKSGIIL